MVQTEGQTRIVGIDSSSKVTGISLFVDGSLDAHRVVDLSKIKDSNERLNLMCIKILECLDELSPTHITIEHPNGAGSNVLVVAMLSEILGCVRGYALTHGVGYEEMNPSEWRKLLAFDQGKKKREELKQMSMDLIKNLYGIDVGDDLADAICIGRATVVKYGKG